MSESVNEELNRIKSNIVNTYSTLSDVGLISEGDTNSDNLANTVKNLSWGGGELCDIGLALFIDESAGMRRLLNGQILNIESKYKPFLNKLQLIATAYPNILCTETEWQAIKESSPFGQVGKFVLNYNETGENIVSVRLPAVVNLQGLQDLQYLGDKLEEALPNITGDLQTAHSLGLFSGGQGNGAVKADTNMGGSVGGSSGSYSKGFTFDASRSSSIYKDNAHVQQEAIQYPYYIQVNLTEYNHMIDVGHINNLTDRVYLIDSFIDGTNWYRLYSDGWCEQGGLNSKDNTTINLFIPYIDTNYSVFFSLDYGSGSVDWNETSSTSTNNNRTQSNFTVGTRTGNWEAKGYVAL